MYLELDDYIFSCTSKGLSPKTTKTYRDNIRLFLNTVEKEYKIYKIYKIYKLEEVQKQHIRDYLRMKKDAGRTNRYINSIHKSLKVFFEYCVTEEYILKDPIEKVSWAREEKRVVNTFSDSEE